MKGLSVLIEDAKDRSLLYIIFIAGLAYALSLTSQSVLLNIPLSLLILLVVKYIFLDVKFQLKVPVSNECHLSYFWWKQFCDKSLPQFSSPVIKGWKRRIDSAVIAAAVDEFIQKIVHEFVLDSWYSLITLDCEFPDQVHLVIKHVCGEIYQRIKHMGLVDLLMSDTMALIGNHIQLFQRNLKVIGADAMASLSIEARDEKLKHFLIESNELHPALVSPEAEYKFLQRLMGGLVAKLLRSEDATSPLVRCFSREILASVVLQPIMNFASPEFINAMIECIVFSKDDSFSKTNNNCSKYQLGEHPIDHSVEDKTCLVGKQDNFKEDIKFHDGGQVKYDRCNLPILGKCEGQERNASLDNNSTLMERPATLLNNKDDLSKQVDIQKKCDSVNMRRFAEPFKGSLQRKDNTEAPVTSLTEKHKHEETKSLRCQHRRSKSLDAESRTVQNDSSLMEEKMRICTKVLGVTGIDNVKGGIHHGDQTERRQVLAGHVPSQKLQCQVIGVHFQKVGSRPIAIYSIAVTNSENNTWLVDRRFRNFEQLHHRLREIPNYNLHLPPKRIISSNNDDVFIQERCHLLDKYLKDLLLIPNIAEEHEVWDFLSATSKNYTFGKTTSVMEMLAFNVDNAMVDILRQFKGVSGGVRQSISNPLTISEKRSNLEFSPLIDKNAITCLSNKGTNRSMLDSEEDNRVKSNGDRTFLTTHDGWISDTELYDNYFSFHSNLPSVKKNDNLLNRSYHSENTCDTFGLEDELSMTGSLMGSDCIDEGNETPIEAPSQLIAPLLNLAEKIFQLEESSWIRRSVLWAAKKIFLLVMEDAIDNWILHQIDWLKREDVIASGIQYIQDVILDSDILPFESSIQQKSVSRIFCDLNLVFPSEDKLQNKMLQPKASQKNLELENRIRNLILEAPASFVRIIGTKRYHRCANDMYFFLQSAVSVKQLAYSILELIVITIFPELHDVVCDIHKLS